MTHPHLEADDRHGEALERLLRGYQFTQALAVAVELGVPDLVSAGPRPLAQLADHCGADASALARLLRALTSIGVLEEPEPDVFAPTAMSELLRPGVPGSRRDWLALNAADLYQTWAKLGHSVRTGETATSLVYGMDSWTYRSLHPEQGARFDAAMTENSRRRIDAFIGTDDLSEANVVVDVGGGRGALIAAVATRYPSVRGILIDLPHVVAGAPAVLQGCADRVQVVAGDFFDAVPANGDVYVLSMILHDWDDDEAITILRRCHAAMADHSAVHVYERVLPDGTTRAWEPYFSDLNMLQGPGGRERTEPQWRSLLTAAGFVVRRIIPTPIGLSIIDAHRA